MGGMPEIRVNHLRTLRGPLHREVQVRHLTVLRRSVKFRPFRTQKAPKPSPKKGNFDAAHAAFPAG